MRLPITLLALALAFLSAPAFASAPRDTLPQSFPAVMWRDLDSAELGALRLAASSSDSCDTVAVFRRRLPPGVVLNVKGDAFRWWAAPVSNEVQRMLPGVRFFHEEYDPYNNPTEPYHYAIALYKGLRYELRPLNKLLTDVGFKFDTSEVPAIAKIAVLWTLMEKQAVLHTPPGDLDRDVLLGVPPPSPAARATAIPIVTFREIGWGEWEQPTYKYHKRAIEIQLVVNGEPTTAWMMPGTGNLVPEWLELYRQLHWFMYGSSTKPPEQATPAPQE
jgi:hypothetical protein